MTHSVTQSWTNPLLLPQPALPQPVLLLLAPAATQQPGAVPLQGLPLQQWVGCLALQCSC